MLLLSALLSLTLLVVAGLTMALALRPGDQDLATLDGPERERAWLGLLALGLAWGLGVVPTLAFLVFTATGWPVSWATLYGCAVALLAAGLFIWRKRDGKDGRALLPSDFGHALRRHHIPLLATVAIGVFYLLRYDQSGYTLMESCIHELGFVAVGALQLDVSPMVSDAQDARLAVPAVMSGFLAVFQSLGLHALFGFCGTMLAFGGYQIGVARGGQGSGWIGMVMLSLNPYVLRIPLIDENLVTLAFCAALVPWLMLRRAPWLQLGVIAGLVLGMRHIMVLAMPAILLACWLDGRSARKLALFAGVTLLATIPWHLHHYLAMGSIFRFESFSQMPPTPHDFGFGTVMWNGLLNWPFHDHVVRTPHNPYPTFAMWPLYLVDHLGAALSAAAVIGVAVGVMRSRADAAVWALFFALPMAALLPQENWDYPNKMNVVLILFWSPMVWTVDGFRALRTEVTHRSWPIPMLALLIMTATVAGGEAISDWRVPADTRYAGVEARRYGAPGAFGGERWDYLETPGLMELARTKASDIGLLPDYGRATGWRTAFSMANLRALWRTAKAPRTPEKSTPWGWLPGEVPTHGPPLTVTLELSTPPWRNADWLRLDEGPADIDLTLTEGVQVVGPMTVPWSDRPLTLLTTPAGAPVSGVMMVFGDHSFIGQQGVKSDRQRYRYRDLREEFQWLMLEDGVDDPSAPMWAKRRHLPASGSSLRLRVPAGGFDAVLVVSILGARHMAWKALVGQDGVQMQSGRSVVRN